MSSYVGRLTNYAPDRETGPVTRKPRYNHKRMEVSGLAVEEANTPDTGSHENQNTIMLKPDRASVEYLRSLSEAGFDDVLVLSRDTAEEVLTEKRMELLQELSTAEVSSMRELARQVERDISIVSRDLDVLYEADIIDYEQTGRSKKPILAHENVVIDPLVFDGDVLGKSETDSREEHVPA